MRRWWLLALPCVLALGTTDVRAGLDGLFIWAHQKHNCPPPMYSKLNYWAPSVYRINARLYPRNEVLFSPNTTPEICPRYVVETYPCPGVGPPSHPYGDPAAPLRQNLP